EDPWFWCVVEFQPYVPVILCLPWTVVVSLTGHEALPAVAPSIKLQLAAIGLNVPVELDVKLTEPVGVVGLEEVSITVAVQVLAVFTVTEAGEHWTLVVVW